MYIAHPHYEVLLVVNIPVQRILREESSAFNQDFDEYEEHSQDEKSQECHHGLNQKKGHIFDGFARFLEEAYDQLDSLPHDENHGNDDWKGGKSGQWKFNAEYNLGLLTTLELAIFCKDMR